MEKIENKKIEDKIKFIELYNIYEEKKENANFSKEESKFIQGLLKSNPELTTIYNKSLDERKKEIEKLKNEMNNASEKEEIKIIQEVYGFNVGDIQNYKLNNGVEIFKFYAPDLKRIVVLQNRQDLSLVEKLKEKQAFNEKFQTNSDKQNTNGMMEDERQKDNVELNMIYPSEIGNYQTTINNFNLEQTKKFHYIIKNIDNLKIKMINLNNLIYLDQNDDIKELNYDKEKDIVEVQDPALLTANVEKIDTSDRVDKTLSHDAQIDQLANRYEDEPEEKDEYEQLEPRVQAQTVTYKEQPGKLNELSPEKRKYWEHNIELYNIYKNKPLVKKKIPPHTTIYTADGRGNGTIDIVLLCIITLITTAAMVLVAYQIYK